MPRLSEIPTLLSFQHLVHSRIYSFESILVRNVWLDPTARVLYAAAGNSWGSIASLIGSGSASVSTGGDLDPEDSAPLAALPDC